MVINLKKLLLITLCVSITLAFCSFFIHYENKTNSVDNQNISKKTVVIDAGHGGKDAGTIGIDGTEEKKINLEIAKTLYDYLMVCGINSVLIRNGDFEIYKENEERNRSDLYNRLDFVNSFENSVLISVHQNHFENEREWGTQIWYSANTPESKIIADNILINVKDFLQPNNKRENKESDNSYYILYKASVPSVMVECGFMSNTEENRKLQDFDYQKDISYCILTGICNIV